MAQVRLQKLLSERGVASRRKAEELIAAGKVKVNGHVAQLGDKADERKDHITVCGKKIEPAQMPVYILLHKPRGFITTMKDEKDRKCVEELVRGVGVRVFPVGRLDKDSEGMLILTNDGDFANAVIHPSSHVPKRYRVTVRAEVTDQLLEPIRRGMTVDGEKMAPADVGIMSAEKERSVVEMVLYEGKNREIRKMCEQLGLEVMRLRRTSIGPVKLGMLPPGKWRYLQPREVKALVIATGRPEKIAADYIKNGKVDDRDYHSSRR